MNVSLYDEQGQRLFFNEKERRAFIRAANVAVDPTTRTFCSLLHYTGCNFTEALNLTSQQVDPDGRAIMFQGSGPRSQDIKRAVPVPASFIDLLEEVHDIRRLQSSLHAAERLWPLGKVTMYKRINSVIAQAKIDGPHASPKGIRHGFLVHAITRRIILTRIQAWLGHAHVDHTADYAQSLMLHAPELVGDELTDAALMW